MFSLNRVIVIGYQTQPVTVRQISSGMSVTDLNLVTPYSFTGEGAVKEGKAFHVVTLWGPMAEVAGKFLRPGGQVFVSGRLQTDSWEDEKTSEKRSKTKIVAQDMILLDPKEGQIKVPENASLLTQCVNRVDLVGNVTRDPEMRTTTSGQKVLTLGVATNERWKDRNSGEARERTEFHSVVVWGDLADQVAKSIRKGQRVYVAGRVQTRAWETKDGAKRTTTEVIADSVLLLGVRNATAESVLQTSPMTSAASEPVNTPAAGGVDAVEDPVLTYKSDIKAEDLPF